MAKLDRRKKDKVACHRFSTSRYCTSSNGTEEKTFSLIKQLGMIYKSLLLTAKT